jgi:hypothetical protein
VLLASGLSDDFRGGLHALTSEGFAPLDDVSTVGLAVSADGQRLARVLYLDSDSQAAGHVLVYDARGVRTYHRIDDLHEAHGVHWTAAGELAVVSTGADRILWLDAGGAVTRRWTAHGPGDCWHLNCLAERDGHLVTTAFGRFDAHRGWERPVRQREPTGVLVDLESRSTLIDGLTAPHDPMPLPDGTWLINDSGANATLHVSAEGVVLRRADLGGWTRGLAIDDDHLYVGISVRGDRTGHAGASAVAKLDRATFTEVERWPFPNREIFALAWASPELVEGVRLGFGRRPGLDGIAHGAVDLAAGMEARMTVEESDAPVRIATMPTGADAGEWLSIEFVLENRSGIVLTSGGSLPIMVGGQWSTTDGDVVGTPARAQLPGAVLPAATARGLIHVPVPEVPGRYVLRIGALQEGVHWFHAVQPEQDARGIIDVASRVPASTLTPD